MPAGSSGISTCGARTWSRPSFKPLIDEETPIFGKRAARITD